MKPKKCYECLRYRVFNNYSSICFDCDCNLRAFSKLENCFLCNKLGTKKRVSARNDCYGWNNEIRVREKDRYKAHEDYTKNYLLCTGCWNKIKPIAKRLNEVDEIRILINKLDREISKCRKLQPPASCANSLLPL